MAPKEEKEELYEIVPTDAYSDYSTKSDQLEKEIDEIKTALKSAVGLAKVESEAQAIIGQMLDMVKSSQKLVEQVALANQQLAQKVQEALDRMNDTNAALSEKLGTILDTFMQATESMGEEPDDSSKLISSLTESMNAVVQQNKRVIATLDAIEKNLRRTAVRAPQAYPPPRQRIQPRYAPIQEESEEGYDDELPPPPFPP